MRHDTIDHTDLSKNLYKEKEGRIKKIMKEHDEQVALFKYLNAKEIIAFAIPNGGYRDIITAKRLKDEGVKKGVPDVFIPIKSWFYSGLFIEMKSFKGKVSKEQEFWMKALKEEGFKTIVCRSAKEAIAVVKQYLKENERKCY